MGKDVPIEELPRGLLSGMIDPVDVEVKRIAAHLDAGDRKKRRAAAASLRRVIETEPTRGTDCVETLCASLSDESIEVRLHVAACLSSLSEHDPDVVSSCHDQVFEQLRAEHRDRVQTELLAVLVHVARADPSSLIGSVDAVSELAFESENRNVRNRALTVLATIGESDPDVVLPFVGSIRELIREEVTTFEGTGAPDSSINLRETIEGRHRSEYVRTLDTIRAGLVALGSVGETEPETLRDVIGAETELLRRLLEIPSQEIRGLTAGILSCIAEQSPEDVQPLTPSLIDLLDDEAFVRVHAADALSSLGTNSAHEAVRAVQKNESDPALENALDSTSNDAETEDS